MELSKYRAEFSDGKSVNNHQGYQTGNSSFCELFEGSGKKIDISAKRSGKTERKNHLQSQWFGVKNAKFPDGGILKP